MKVYIVEAQLVDHPDYETFVDVYATQQAAIDAVTTSLNDVISDVGEEDEVIKTTVTGKGHLRLEVVGSQVYFISEYTPK